MGHSHTVNPPNSHNPKARRSPRTRGVPRSRNRNGFESRGPGVRKEVLLVTTVGDMRDRFVSY